MGGSPEQERLVSSSKKAAASSSISHDDHEDHPSSTTRTTTVTSTLVIIVSLYVLSGCMQPILMTVLKSSGLADPSCQLYMLFYYLGTASAIFLVKKKKPAPPPPTTTKVFGGGGIGTTIQNKRRKTINIIMKACGIALWDIAAQTMNYTGAGLAGPTIFAIIYSSVTIWAAIYSQVFLKRRMNKYQWISVWGVFGGLALTATDSLELGSGVTRGLLLVVLGSSMHGLFYVMSEAVMTTGTQRLSVEENCAIQGITAATSFGVWQIFYTIPRWEVKLKEPMQLAGTSVASGLTLLIVFGFVSFIHSITFYYTLRHLEGGSTSAGVFKALQAVLVFVITHFIYCGKVGGNEMCFSTIKFVSLITVSGGVLSYGYATTSKHNNNKSNKSGGGGGMRNDADDDIGRAYDSIIVNKEDDDDNDDDDGHLEIGGKSPLVI